MHPRALNDERRKVREPIHATCMRVEWALQVLTELLGLLERVVARPLHATRSVVLFQGCTSNHRSRLISRDLPLS
jgi:hypothetical protein